MSFVPYKSRTSSVIPNETWNGVPEIHDECKCSMSIVILSRESYWSWLYNYFTDESDRLGLDPMNNSYYAYAWTSYSADLHKQAMQAAFAIE